MSSPHVHQRCWWQRCTGEAFFCQNFLRTVLLVSHSLESCEWVPFLVDNSHSSSILVSVGPLKPSYLRPLDSRWASSVYHNFHTQKAQHRLQIQEERMNKMSLGCNQHHTITSILWKMRVGGNGLGWDNSKQYQSSISCSLSMHDLPLQFNYWTMHAPLPANDHHCRPSDLDNMIHPSSAILATSSLIFME